MDPFEDFINGMDEDDFLPIEDKTTMTEEVSPYVELSFHDLITNLDNPEALPLGQGLFSERDRAAHELMTNMIDVYLTNRKDRIPRHEMIAITMSCAWLLRSALDGLERNSSLPNDNEDTSE